MTTNQHLTKKCSNHDFLIYFCLNLLNNFIHFSLIKIRTKMMIIATILLICSYASITDLNK